MRSVGLEYTWATPMHDDKRRLRQLKRDTKRSGNRKRRRFLKDVEAEPEQFDFGRARSDVMNEPRPKSDGPEEPGSD